MILMMFFWVESPYGLVGSSQGFGEACCLHLQGITSALCIIPHLHFFMMWNNFFTGALSFFDLP
jgi:hypothetical protein